MIRLWVSISLEEIEFCRLYKDEKGNNVGKSRIYKTTPKRIVRVVYASNKYTHYRG